TDAADRLIVTVSEDKTLRLWNAADGLLLRTIVPPTGKDDEGKLYAVAISPDGQTIATGGWTGFQWDRSISIYLFESGTGRMICRITQLPAVVLDLAFSPDGHYLA